jgi:hypothetical protein
MLHLRREPAVPAAVPAGTRCVQPPWFSPKPAQSAAHFPSHSLFFPTHHLKSHHAVRSQGLCRLQGRGPRGPPGDREPHPLHQGHGLQGHPEDPRRWVVAAAAVPGPGAGRRSQTGAGRAAPPSANSPASAMKAHSLWPVAPPHGSRGGFAALLRLPFATALPTDSPPPPPPLPRQARRSSSAPRTPTSWTPLRRPASTCPTPAARVGFPRAADLGSVGRSLAPGRLHPATEGLCLHPEWPPGSVRGPPCTPVAVLGRKHPASAPSARPLALRSVTGV